MRTYLDEGTGEVTLKFRPEEIRLATYNIEHLAAMLELSGWNTEKMWQFAMDLRKLNADKNGDPLLCDINGK